MFVCRVLLVVCVVGCVLRLLFVVCGSLLEVRCSSFVVCNVLLVDCRCVLFVVRCLLFVVCCVLSGV